MNARIDSPRLAEIAERYCRWDFNARYHFKEGFIQGVAFAREFEINRANERLRSAMDETDIFDKESFLETKIKELEAELKKAHEDRVNQIHKPFRP